MEERLQKILARAGLGSRRACEELIRQRRVVVNGQVAELGQKADPDRDRITVDGRPIQVSDRRIYIALYKPRGVLSDQGERSGRLSSARDLVPLAGHLFPVGRLDLNSEGLILLTNDGELAHVLMHPRFEHTKEYHVCVGGHPSEDTLRQWRRGVLLDGRQTAPAQVSVLRREQDHTWLQVVLREGRKRLIRRVADRLGHPVRRLIRVRIGSVHLGTLKPGEWRHLTRRELRELDRFKQPGERRDIRRTKAKDS
jgi:pseudouridine synthase